MKKQDHELSQMNLFPYDPEIKNLGVVDVKLKGGALDITMMAATQATDLSMIKPEQWAKAAAGWLVRLTNGNDGMADAYLNAAQSEFAQEAAAREADELIGYARQRGATVQVSLPDDFVCNQLNELP
jgi:hypothetical protein